MKNKKTKQKQTIKQKQKRLSIGHMSGEATTKISEIQGRFEILVPIWSNVNHKIRKL